MVPHSSWPSSAWAGGAAAKSPAGAPPRAPEPLFPESRNPATGNRMLSYVAQSAVFPVNSRGANPSSSLSHVFHLWPKRGHGGLRFLPEPPSHGGWRTCLCPALHPANPEVKIQGQNKEMLAAACQMFLGKTEAEIAHIALETLEGHQRAIMAHMTVEEIYKDRQKFSEQVFKVASSDLVNMGISVVSYTLKDIHDDQDYLHSLGKARTAQVQKDARIGEAEAKRDAGIREAKAKQEKVSAQYLSEIEMAKAQRDYELKKAAYDIEVNTRRAQADLAYQLQVAKTKQQIEEQRVQVQVVERAQQVAVQEQEIARREKELEARVRKPAEAERYKLERLAAAEKSQLIMQAEAEAESVRMRGEAEAFAIGARARAEAEQMAKKAEAFQLYQEAAQLDMLLEKLPQVAEEISGPLTSANKITLVSSGSGAMGAAKVTGEVLDILSRLPESVERLTGVSISQVNHKPLRTA
ncbi:flotillin-1 isoform X1 [Globicephala melas]|uniref:flotillin-1 isoform X1 n=1 Tax=Globicephala melas TaxID=9731 RepID=UPI00293D9BA7|nr:flotillin-1 isoform X1 [Globicephala melas]